jgi:hypothetical protein
VRLATVIVVISLVGSAAAAQAQTAPCNPYVTASCPGPGSSGPNFNPYTQPPSGPYTGSGPYVPNTDLFPVRWALNGDLFLDQGAYRFGWLILDNLASEEQHAVIEYASEGWALPSYEAVTLAPKARVAVGLHGRSALNGVYFSVRVYFERAGATHATFRPNADNTQGQHDVPGVFIPADSTR